MELKHWFLIILVSYWLQTRRSGVFCDSYKIQLLGLFTTTNCQKGYEFECHNAKINRDTMLELHRNEQNRFSATVHTCFKDIQNSTRILADIVLPLTTDERTYYQINCENVGGVWQTSTKRIIIFSYLSYHLTRFLSALILPLESIILISVTDKPIYPAYYGENSHSIYSYEAGFGLEMYKDINEIKKEMNVTYAAFLNLNMGNLTLTSEGKSTRELCELEPYSHKWCLYINPNPHDCYKRLDIDVTNSSAIHKAMTLLRQFEITFFVLPSYQNSYHTFTVESDLPSFNSGGFFHLPMIAISDDMELNRNPWHSTFKYHSGNILTNFQGASQLNSLFRYAFRLPSIIIEEAQKDYLDDGWKFFFDNFIFKNEAFQELIQMNLPGQSLTYDIVKFVVNHPFYKQLFEKTMIDIMDREETLLQLISFWKRLYYISNINLESLKVGQTFDPSEALKYNRQCEYTKPYCKPGHQLVHSFYTEPEWTESYGWNCQKCSVSTYKPLPGNDEKCIPCLYPNTVNKNHTTCFDPFTEVKLDYRNPVMLLVLIPSGLLTLLTLVTMVTFLVKRDTPIVKLANRTMTAIQLFSHLSLFLLPNLPIFVKKTSTNCLLGQIFLGMAFSLTLSINISKSQKLYMIVNSKLRMSSTEILKTKVSEWIIILVALITNALLHITSFGNAEVTVKQQYFDQTLTKETYCSNNIMIYIQLLIAVVLSLCNGIQGFRARNMPSRLQETNHVIYSSFISFIVFVAATASYFSQRSMVNRSFIILIVTVLYNMTHFLLLYGYKLFVILFRPRLNTKEAFNKKRLENVG